MTEEFIADLKEIKDEIWGYDIPSPTCPEYREHHEQIQALMKFVKGKIDKWEKAAELEQKTAAWVGIDQEPHEIYECNACGGLLYEEDTKDFIFCPSCGAKMEVEE